MNSSFFSLSFLYKQFSRYDLVSNNLLQKLCLVDLTVNISRVSKGDDLCDNLVYQSPPHQ